MHGCGKDCLIVIHLGCHRSAVSLSALNVSPLTQTIALMWGSDPSFSSPLVAYGLPFLPLTVIADIQHRHREYPSKSRAWQVTFQFLYFICPLASIWSATILEP